MVYNTGHSIYKCDTWWRVEAEAEWERDQEVECRWMVGLVWWRPPSIVDSLVTCRVNFEGLVMSGGRETHSKILERMQGIFGERSDMRTIRMEYSSFAKLEYT